MKLEELYDKYECEECGAWEYTYKITIGHDSEDTYETYIRLCKKCLLKLLKAIIER
jgi:hypothetical protein